MKQRVIYSPKGQKGASQLDINFKKSPQKFVFYDSPQPPPQLSMQTTQPYFPSSRDFQNVKKISDDASSLRQTMGIQKANRIQKRTSNFEFQDQEEKPNKLNDFLRQTMSYKSTKAFSQKYQSDFTISNDNYVKRDDLFNSKKSFKNQDNQRIIQSRSSINLLQGQKSLDQCQLLNQKMDRQKKLIQQLKKIGTKQDQKTYFKNLNYNKSPSYLDLDREKQTDQKGFRKKKKEQSAYFMTPKTSKGTYDTRFNSSPLIPDLQKKQQKASTKQCTISSLTDITPIKRKISLNLTPPQQSSLLDQFEIGKKLGQGKFGCVNIIRHKKTFGVFALKKIPKAMIKSHMMIDQLALQIRIQSCLNHKNLLGLYGSFDDATHLYMVLEYMNGGTLYEKLKKGILTQKQAAAVIKQVTESLDYLHDLGIAHRDIKPQNIVISNNVYKLCDFGWAAICTQRRKTYCGTFDYVAPQILQGVQYDMTVDLWCLGVMTFELMTGKAPFYHISRKQTMKKILNVQNQNISFPETMSEQAKDFIDKLVKKNPAQRIKASQALLHPFIKDAQFD